jgi:hypothetical protein
VTGFEGPPEFIPAKAGIQGWESFGIPTSSGRDKTGGLVPARADQPLRIGERGWRPWNLRNHSISAERDSPTVDGEPLIFFHFHGLKRLSRRVFDAGAAAAGLSPVARRHIYRPYLRALLRSARMFVRMPRTIGPGTSIGDTGEVW